MTWGGEAGLDDAGAGCLSILRRNGPSEEAEVVTEAERRVAKMKREVW